MPNLLQRYTHWLHTRWPAGVVEKMPRVNDDYSTNVPGLYVVGDLTGIPLLKFSADSGARAVQHIAADQGFQKAREADKSGDMLDLVIVGAGVSGMAAALEARKQGLHFQILEATEPFSTIVNFPKGKPIYTYPTGMVPAGDLQFTQGIKEPLVEELKAQTLGQGIAPRPARVEKIDRNRASFEVLIAGEESLMCRRVIVGIGRSGNFRKLNVPGEDLPKVYNRLHDPKEFRGQEVLVVGGGDSALEAAIAIAQCGASVSLSYRKSEFSRPKPENVTMLQQLMADPMADVGIETPSSERVTTSSGRFLNEHRQAGSIRLYMKSSVREVRPDSVLLRDSRDEEIILPNQAVFTMTGREAPLDFFRRSAVRINGEMGLREWSALSLFMLFCTFVYNWKSGGTLTALFQGANWFPFNIPALLEGLSAAANNPASLMGILKLNLGQPGFYYSLLYTALVIIFGIRRIRKRKTPYITWQTASLALVQVLPLFLLPYIILPYMGLNGAFDSGWMKVVADELFPPVTYDFGREYWRAFGFILAWPLFIWNVFTWEPMWGWLIISLIQTFAIIPGIIYFWGKGAYCGWICSCGAMAETLGDDHRHKMPHGPRYNRWNMLGQGILAVAFILLFSKMIHWIIPDTVAGRMMADFHAGLLYGWSLFGIQLNYKYLVDLFLAGIIGYGAYFWYSGRVWCRFACPLAALMHIYSRFSRFRIIADKKKCISCNVCTSVCHQGIDIMNFANKGLPMADPECVRCSACVQSCPTGVLQFAQVDRTTGEVIKPDRLAASPVLMKEMS